ncbi:MAG TPA: NADPH-dependent FMN reductase [Roseiarcus sp.]
MKLLALSGSLRAASTNTATLEALSALAPPGVEIPLYRDLGALPLFNPDDDEQAPPPAVAALRALVGSAAGLIIAAPEYAHGVPGAFKNALDWLVASDAFPGKPVAMINTAPRSFHAQSALRETLATMSARLIPEAFVALPLTGKMVDAAEIAANPRFAAALRAALDAFVEAIRGDAA